MAEKKKQNLVAEVGKAALRGASRGGGTVGSTFGAVQSGISNVGNIKRGFDIHKQKSSKPKPVAKPAPAKKPVVKKK